MANKKNGMSKESLTLILIFEMMLGLLFLLAFKGGGEYAMIFFIFVCIPVLFALLLSNSRL
jgi:hypothetical protein